MTTRHLLFLAILLCVASAHAVDFDQNPAFLRFNDVAYVPGGGPVQSGERREIMDIYAPVGASGPLPVLLLIHGGGWNSGNGDGYIDGLDFLQTGDFVVAAMNYRLNSEVAPLATQIDDVKAAIRFLKANAASYNIDAERFALFGNSAGAHLASLAATTSNVPFFGAANDAANLANIGISTSIAGCIAWSTPPEPPGLMTLWPGEHVDAADPDFLLFHAVNDPLVGVQFARAFRDDLRAAGIGAQMIEFNSSNHFPSDSEKAAAAPVILDFLEQRYAAVPEPSSIALLVAGTASLAARRKKRTAGNVPVHTT